VFSTGNAPKVAAQGNESHLNYYMLGRGIDEPYKERYRSNCTPDSVATKARASHSKKRATRANTQTGAAGHTSGSPGASP